MVIEKFVIMVFFCKINFDKYTYIYLVKIVYMIFCCV